MNNTATICHGVSIHSHQLLFPQSKASNWIHLKRKLFIELRAARLWSEKAPSHILFFKFISITENSICRSELKHTLSFFLHLISFILFFRKQLAFLSTWTCFSIEFYRWSLWFYAKSKWGYQSEKRLWNISNSVSCRLINWKMPESCCTSVRTHTLFWNVRMQNISASFRWFCGIKLCLIHLHGHLQI